MTTPFEKQQAYARSWYQKNREKLIERQREYREAHKESILEWNRTYAVENREKILARQRAYREANREVLAQKQRERRAMLKGNKPDTLSDGASDTRGHHPK